RFSADWDKYPAEWEKQFTEKLQSLHAIDLIFAQNDRLGFAAWKVCKKLGLDHSIKIIGIDGLPGKDGGIDLVEKGILKATILYPTGGAEAFQTRSKFLRKKLYKRER